MECRFTIRLWISHFLKNFAVFLDIHKLTWISINRFMDVYNSIQLMDILKYSRFQPNYAYPKLKKIFRISMSQFMVIHFSIFFNDGYP